MSIKESCDSNIVKKKNFISGVLLAIFEKAQVISPVINSLEQSTSAGTVSAGYQNFLICIEMLFAAIALRYAFPYQVYAAGCVTDSRGRSVTMQSISSSLKVCKFFYPIFFNYKIFHSICKEKKK